jgi:hypothetical protein
MRCAIVTEKGKAEVGHYSELPFRHPDLTALFDYPDDMMQQSNTG